MTSVRVSPKYQIVIPQEIRETMNIRPGEYMQMFVMDGRIELVPVVPIQSLRGRYKGLNTTVERDEDRV